MQIRGIEYALKTVVLQGAARLYRKLAGAVGGLSSYEKSDGTRATDIDLENETSMGRQLGDMLSDYGVVVVGEEGTRNGHYNGRRRVVFFDPTDGTANVRLLAPGSTVGACLYNPLTYQFEASVVADPWLGRLFFTDQGQTYQDRFDVNNPSILGTEQKCQVSQKTFADGGEVLIEVVHGFRRNDWLTGEKRGILSNDGAANLVNTLQNRLDTKVRSLSSNLMHQLLVASGGDGVATIMTAIGGPWDMSGVGLVLGAGGHVVFVRLEEGQFVKTDDPLLADMVISANNEETAWQIFYVLTGRLG